jgi:hypothetical protein
MSNHSKYCPFLLILTLSAGCLQQYDPPAIANPTSNLVVEGFIDDSGDTTVFNLSRTFALTASATQAPELSATVAVEGADNSNYPLTNAGNGAYWAILPPLNPAIEYRLFITDGGKQYASDYVPLIPNPSIDSVNWVRNDNGVQVYANTHDPTGKALYFRWNYEETWEFMSPFFATLQFVNDSLENYSPNTISTCWKYNNSSSVLLASSVHLSPDEIYEMPMTLVPVNSQQISVEYSILVRQFVLNIQAFTWWQTVQNNTENIGSIFGVLPTTNPGNIHCLTDTSEMVVGYVSGGNLQSKRIFITNNQVFPWDYQSGCYIENTTKDSFKYFYPNGFLPIDWHSFPTRIDFSKNYCVDCTLTGTNIQPTFWQ